MIGDSKRELELLPENSHEALEARRKATKAQNKWKGISKGFGAVSALFGFGNAAAQINPATGGGGGDGGGDADSASGGSDSGLDDKWGQPILQPPPAKLMLGAKEIANAQPPPGLF